MNIGICDDLQEERERLKALLLAYAPDFTMLEYPNGEALLDGLAHGDTLDLLFLDIYMGDLNGIETAEKLRETHKNLPIIFLTTSADFALSAFGVRAIGYLLKPINHEKLVDYLKDYSDPVQQPDIWVVATGHGDVALPVTKIVYCEQRGHYGDVHMEDGMVHPVRMTFAEITSHLRTYPSMIPCGKSYLVNFSFIRTLNRQEAILLGGVKLPVPRRAYGALREAYLSFYKGGA